MPQLLQSWGHQLTLLLNMGVCQATGLRAEAVFTASCALGGDLQQEDEADSWE